MRVNCEIPGDIGVPCVSCGLGLGLRVGECVNLVYTHPANRELCQVGVFICQLPVGFVRYIPFLNV